MIWDAEQYSMQLMDHLGRAWACAKDLGRELLKELGELKPPRGYSRAVT